MAQITEAACLLQSGALYPQRSGFKTTTNEDLFLGFKPGGFSIYFGDAPIYHFDLEGRWQRAYLNDRHYLKGLDTTTRTIERVREGANLILHRETLSGRDACTMDEHVRRMASDLIEGLQTGELAPVSGPETSRPIPPDRLGDFLGRIAGWKTEDWKALRQRYEATYPTFPSLPPNALNAVVLQVTHGQRLGRSFGGGTTMPPSTPDLDAFRSHVSAVRDLLARRLCQHRSIFLDGPDTLRLPLEQILERMEAAREVFPTTPGIGPGKPSEFNPEAPEARLDGFQIFLDEPEGVDLRAEHWASLASAHLREVAVGLTSGDRAIRERFGSTFDNAEFSRLIADLKGAGLRVTILALLHTGRPGQGEAHIESTLELLRSLPLGKDDLITLVDAREYDTMTVAEHGAQPHDGQRRAELDRFSAELTAHRKLKGVKFAPYSLEKQWS